MKGLDQYRVKLEIMEETVRQKNSQGERDCPGEKLSRRNEVQLRKNNSTVYGDILKDNVGIMKI